MVARPDAGVLERVPADRPRVGDRPRPRDRAGRPDRDRPRAERPRGPRVPRPGRVPPADPVRCADPAALPHARAGAQERGLPRGVRRVLADPRADDVRRPRRRPHDHRHGALVRRAQARAALADHPAERCPVHRYRDAAGVGGRADPGLHGGALHGNAGPREDAQLRAVLRADHAAVRARSRDGGARTRDASPVHGARAPCAALASVAARWRPREGPGLRGAQGRRGDRRPDRDRRSSGSSGRGRRTASSGRPPRRSPGSSTTCGSSSSSGATSSRA